MQIILLEGSWQEIGEKFGKTLSETAHSSLQYLLKGSQRISTHIYQKRGILQKITASAIEALIKIKCLKVDEPYRGFFKGLSSTTGIGYYKLMGYFLSPDIFNYLMALSDRLFKREIPPVFLGCSSVVTLPHSTATGIMYHARNLDYIGGKYWEKGHCITVIKPSGGVASVNVLTEGIFCPGITSVNEEGIAISLHLNFTRSTRFRNTPVTLTALKIASLARTLSEAIDIAKEEKPMAGWSFVLSSAIEAEAVVVELSADKASIIYPESGLLWYTNCYLSQTQKESEYAPSYIWVENNNCRYNRLKELLLQEAGGLSAERLIKIIGDTCDPTLKQQVALGHTISNAANISSALFGYGEDTLWVSTSDVPANRGSFTAYSISALLEGKAEIKGKLTGNRMREDKEKAFRYFVEACFVWEENCNPSEALSYIIQAERLDPDEPLYTFVKSLLLAKTGTVEEAIVNLESISQHPLLNSTRRAQVNLWLARLLDAAGRRSEALEWYREVIKMRAPIDMQLKAIRGLKKPYRLKMLRKTDLIPFIADTVEP